MKKRKKILVGCLAVAGVIVVLGLVGGWFLRRHLRGVDDVSGPRGAIPPATASPGPVTKGEADWPCWRGPTRDGRSPVTGIRTDWSGGLRKVWEVDYLCQGTPTQTWSAPVVQGNRLVVPGRDPERDHVFCLDPETGGLIWHRSYEAPVDAGQGPGARATPFIDDDRVYTFGKSGDLACWRIEDGSPVWRRNVGDDGGKAPCGGTPRHRLCMAGGSTSRGAGARSVWPTTR
ncbi:MAG: outer membrane protein assembly factor BamB family protein [Planctomycetota bacterium]|jgi:hypothetical protein